MKKFYIAEIEFTDGEIIAMGFDNKDMIRNYYDKMAQYISKVIVVIKVDGDDLDNCYMAV